MGAMSMEIIQIPQTIFDELIRRHGDKATYYDLEGKNGKYTIIEHISGMAFGYGWLHQEHALFALWLRPPKDDYHLSRPVLEIMAGPVGINSENEAVRRLALAKDHHLIDDVRFYFGTGSYSFFAVNLELFMEIMELADSLVRSVIVRRTYKEVEKYPNSV